MIEPELKQRGRAAVDFLTAMTMGSKEIREETTRDINNVVEQTSMDKLPDDLDVRNEYMESQMYQSSAFRVQQLIGEWHARNHGLIAIDAFNEIEPELSAEFSQLETGGSSLQTDSDFVAPDYWDGVEFHRTVGTWEGHEHMGFIHAEIIHRKMVAKFFPGGIFKQRLDVAGLAPKKHYARIFDMGCSSGHFTQALAETYPKSEISGVDLSLRMLQHAQRLANSRGWSWKLYQRAAEQSGFESDYFDLVTSYILLHELPAETIKAVFAEAYRVLKPGGDMLMSDVTRYADLDKLQQWQADRGALYGGEPHWRDSASLDLAEVARQVGFINVEAGGMNTKPYPYVIQASKPA